MFSRSWTLGRSYLRRSRLMQIGVIASFAWAGQALAQWGNLPVPGSVLGLTMVLLLLASGVMRVNHIRRGASWLLAEMLLFFVPAVLADVVALVFWPLATVMAYVCARAVYRRRGYWWSSTLVMAPALLLALALCLHAGYADYMRGSHWLMAMLSPVIVSFALPLYQERALIRRYWPILLVGVTVGSTIAGVSAWLLASWLDLPAEVRMSLVPRSVATPFAMTLSSKLGGVPDLTAVFVIVTGVLGALMGQTLHRWLPLRSSLARGALFGMGAHGAGAAKARELAAEEGSIAGLVMVLAGLSNVLITPGVAYLLAS